MSEIKASEILLNLDNRMKNMEKQLKLQEFQLRIIIDNLNKLYKTTTSIEQKEKLPEVVKASPAVESDKDYNFKSEVRSDDKKTEKKKVAVTQLLKFNNGDPLVGANVIINIHSNKVLIKKVTTNTVGRWQAFLTPQKYIITIIGTNQNSEDVEFEQIITIPESDTPFTIPSPKIN